ncbi:MAG: hypothetical protein AAGC63_08120 [Propionicimonas sp.]|nr:hypothetical protein [Propionicimonas sp.]
MEKNVVRRAVPEKVGKPLLAVALSIAAIAAAPLVMGPSYAALQPRLGAFTLIVVEVVYALFIDFPLTAAYVAVVSLWFGRRRNPARSAVGFVAVFFGLILLCIVLAPTSDLLAYWALADTFPTAGAELVSGLGLPTAAMLVGAFVVFDVLLCATGGVTADVLAGGLRRPVGEPHPGAAPGRRTGASIGDR